MWTKSNKLQWCLRVSARERENYKNSFQSPSHSTPHPKIFFWLCSSVGIKISSPNSGAEKNRTGRIILKNRFAITALLILRLLLILYCGKYKGPRQSRTCLYMCLPDFSLRWVLSNSFFKTRASCPRMHFSLQA